MRKILTVILTAVMAVTFAGCSRQLSEQEYADTIFSTYKTYLSELQDMALKQMDGDKGEEVLAAIDRASAALDEIERINPPALYSSQHQAICEAMPNQRDELNINKRIAEEGQTEELLQQMQDIVSVSIFHEKMFSLIKILREDGYLKPE